MPLLSASLTLPPVITWILVRDRERLVAISDEKLLSDCETEYAQYLVKRLIPRRLRKRLDIDSSRLVNADLGGAPPYHRPLRRFLMDAGVGPDQLVGLTPENVDYFIGTVLLRLQQWYRLKGNTEEQVKELVQAYLRALNDWLENNGVNARVLELAQRALYARSVAQNEWSQALDQLISALAGSRVQATARRKGLGDPEPILAFFWPRLTFGERRIGRRGLLTCAVYKADPTGDCWADLAFAAHEVFSCWPAEINREVGKLSDGAKKPKPAPDSLIRQHIKLAYDTADSTGKKPPNIRELPDWVLPTLERDGYVTSKRRIEEIGTEDDFKKCRRRSGLTWRAERLRKVMPI